MPRKQGPFWLRISIKFDGISFMPQVKRPFSASIGKQRPDPGDIQLHLLGGMKRS